MSLLTHEQIQAAFDFMTANSDEVGVARAMVIRTKFKADKVWSRLVRTSDEKTMELRKAYASEHPEYEEAMEAYANAEAIWERLRDQRNKAELIIEAWRTMQSNERGIMRAVR